MTTGRRRRPVLHAALIALIAALLVGPSIAPVAARTAPTTGTRVIVQPYLGLRTYGPNRGLAKDANGVVLASYGGTLGNQYNPVTISQAAIGYYNALHYGQLSASQRAADEAAFFVQVEWLVNNQLPDGRWLYHFPWGGQPVPWVSAMAEGQAMSALVRANALRSQERYRTAITRARTTFERVWARNGVSQWTQLGTKSLLVYEEYMAPYSPRTLNGWMFAMMGLQDAWTYLGDTAARDDLHRADRGIPAIRALLPYYDTGKWSTYNLKKFSGAPLGTIATRAYHELHILQLHWFAKVADDGTFEHYANKWQKYLDACLATASCPA